MSKIEITEDNCVLNNAAIKSIAYVFSQHKLSVHSKSRENVTKTLDDIFQKITKLNDLETLAKAVVKYCNELSYDYEGVYLFSDKDYKTLIKKCFLPALNKE